MEWPRFQCIQHVRTDAGNPAESWILMVTFPRCAWKESTKLQSDLIWNTHALCGVEDPQGPFQRLQDSFAKRLGLKLPPLKNRFNYHTLVLFYKIRQNLAPKYLCTLVPNLSSTTSGYSFRKFSYPVPLSKSSKTLSTFKTKVRVHLSL